MSQEGKAGEEGEQPGPRSVNTVSPGLAWPLYRTVQVCVDEGGRLLVTGHPDGSTELSDIRGCRGLNTLAGHTGEVGRRTG